MNTRVPLVVRVKPESLATVDRLAKAAGISRAEWVRRALAQAVTAEQMPRPDTRKRNRIPELTTKALVMGRGQPPTMPPPKKASTNTP